MPDAVKPPERCADMAEVRAGVDAIDRELLALLERRFAYMRAAARIKPARDQVRDEARKRQVVDAAIAGARARRLPEGLVAELWELLVEASIAYELEQWNDMRGGRENA